MKLTYLIIPVLLISLVHNGNAGIYDSVVGTVKEAASAVKQDAYNLWAYGKGLVFGEDENNKNGAGVEGRSLEKNVTQIENEKVAKTGIYGRIKNGLDIARQSAYVILFGDDHDDSKKGFLSTVYEKLTKPITKLKQFLLRSDTSTEIPKLLVNTPLGGEDTKKVKDVYNRLLVSDQIKKFADKLNVWDDVLRLRNKILESKNGFESSASDVPIIDVREGPGKRREGQGRAILDDEFNKPTLEDGYYKFTDKYGNSVYRVGDNGFNNREDEVIRNAQSRFKRETDKFRDGVRNFVNSFQGYERDVEEKGEGVIRAARNQVHRRR